MIKGLTLSFVSWFFQIALSSLGVVCLCFLFLKVIPRKPFDEEIPLSPIVTQKLESEWGLNDSALVQATKYFSSVVKGNLGVSVAKPTRTVNEVIFLNLKSTFFLNLTAFILVISGSFFVTGIILYSRNEKFKNVFRSTIASLASLPTFFWAPFLIFILGDKLKLFPSFFDGSVASYILPLFAIFVRPWASLCWVLFDQWNNALNSRALLFAKGKGILNRDLVFSHGFRLSAIPFVQKSGQIFLQVITGSFVVEIMFGFQGLAYELIKAISSRDSTVIVGISLVYCLLSILVTQPWNF